MYFSQLQDSLSPASKKNNGSSSDLDHSPVTIVIGTLIEGGSSVDPSLFVSTSTRRGGGSSSSKFIMCLKSVMYLKFRAQF